ncbi:unnamed protein product [marine sediment metagenome]|uniref:Solute-binding protein family 5 domain-containing protein n=1 Tax=marine sediment metagenome TaxID=412755 RepID=X1L7D8_9ZZZZ
MRAIGLDLPDKWGNTHAHDLPDRESLIHRTRALDRVLLWGHYIIPQWHISNYRVAYWDKFATPKIRPKYSLGLNSWWINPRLEASLDDRKRGLR